MLVTAYLEVAELQALNRQPMYMADWIERLDDFLKMTGRELLTNAGTVSHKDALTKAHEEYEVFRQHQTAEPSTAEKHFLEATEQIKLIQDNRKQHIPIQNIGN